MNKKAIWGIVGIVVVVAIVVGAVALGGNKDNSKTSSTDMASMNMNNSTSANSSSTSKAVATDTVAIQNFAFSPADITVKVGTKVTWTNKDSVTHTVTADDTTNGPSSGNLGPGQTYSFTFSKAGTYKYICSIHTEMKGTVVVTE